MAVQHFVKENTHIPRGMMDFGWGNGYVALPPEHPCHGKDYNDIYQEHDIIVNGGLTFSESASNLDWEEIPTGCETHWIVGFDTMHSWDTLENWPEQRVAQEAKELANQFEQIKG